MIVSKERHRDKSSIHSVHTGTVLIEMIEDLMLGAGYNYTDIARFTDLSPSEIQKLATGKRQTPRFKVYQSLLYFYCKTFYGKEKVSYAAQFLKIKRHHTLAWLEDIIEAERYAAR